MNPPKVIQIYKVLLVGRFKVIRRFFLGPLPICEKLKHLPPATRHMIAFIPLKHYTWWLSCVVHYTTDGIKLHQVSLASGSEVKHPTRSGWVPKSVPGGPQSAISVQEAHRMIFQWKNYRLWIQELWVPKSVWQPYLALPLRRRVPWMHGWMDGWLDGWMDECWWWCWW